MYGLNAIRRINAQAAAQQNADRYHAQYKGDAWHVFDSHTNGWGSSYATAKDAQQAADALNAV